ncbi:hypothetical protein [Hymenobacter sp.]|uniref:hypothetical protein n=1 Tax=Hymenobacter sp. TaxID=1898978 RepID=UPI00286ACCF2|nr:hypothetical protein [Hymenobacter sp.]
MCACCVASPSKPQPFQWLAAALVPLKLPSYRKGSRPFDILATLDPAEGAKASYHAHGLFCRLGVTRWAQLNGADLLAHDNNRPL